MSGPRLIIGVLALTAAGLAVTLGVVLASEDDDSDRVSPGMGGFAGMMQAMGSMDSEAMLTHMRPVLGEEGFARMQEHIRDHNSGQMGANGEMDQTTHAMMDGMMGQMGLIPGQDQQDEHHETPSAAAGTPPASATR